MLLLFLHGFNPAILGAQGRPQEPQNRNSDAVPRELQPSLPMQITYDVKIDVDSVFLNLSVRDRINNRNMSGLQKNDFSVYEDGIRQEIDQFLPTEAPFNLLLLLDVSGSTGSYLKMMKQAAIEFTREINANDRIAVATFNSKVRLAQDFTGDRADAERAIKRIKSGGGTAFYDALMTSLTQYMKGIQSRSAIVVFSDGVDNQLEGVGESGSHVKFDDLFRQIQETDTIVNTIFLNTEDPLPDFMDPGVSSGPGGRRVTSLPRSFPFPPHFPFPSTTPQIRGRHPEDDDEDEVYMKAREQLQLIADQTGGRMFSPTKIDELSGAYSEVADDLRVQYQLGYNSTNRMHDGKWRNIRVELQGKPDAVIRTRRGYFVRKDVTQ